MKDKIHELLKRAKSEKKAGNIKVAINTLKEAKEQLLQGEEGSKQSRRNDTSGDEDEIIYLYRYGNILYGVEEYRRALKYYEEIVERQPNVNTYKSLGDCLRKLNLYDKALEQCKIALEEYAFLEENEPSKANPADKAAVLNSRGLTYIAKAIDPNSYKSTLYTPKMDNKKALKDFEKAIEISEKNEDVNPNPLYYCNKGVALYTLGRKDQGLDFFKKAEQLVKDGKVEELTKQNIHYIKDPLANFIELESKVKEIQAKFEEIQNKLITEQLQQVLQNEYKRFQEDHNELLEFVKSNMLKQEDINSLSEANREELTTKMNQVTTDLSQVQYAIKVIEDSLQAAEVNIADIEKQLNTIDSELSTKLQNHGKILEKYLGEQQNLTETDKVKIKEYYKAFVGTILSVYTGAQAVNSNWVETKKSLVVSLLSAIPVAGSAGARAIELIDAPLSTVISGIASLAGKFVEAGGNFEVSKSIKQDARKFGKLASSLIDMNDHVSEKVLDIVKNTDKQGQILKVTMENLNKLPDALLKKIKQSFCEIPKEKIDEYFYGKMYSTPAERLGNKDAYALLKKYFKSASDEDCKTVFDEAAKSVKEDYQIEPFCNIKEVQKEVMEIVGEAVISDIQDSIYKLCERAVKGQWENKGLFAQKSCSKFFEEKYLHSKLKSQNQSEIPNEKIERVQMIMFKYMCASIINSDNKDMTCVSYFAKEYPTLLKKIANQQPEYFVKEQVVKAAIPTDTNLQNKVLSKLNEMITGQGTREYEEGNYDEYWYEYSKQAMDQLLELRLKSTGIENAKIISADYVFNDSSKFDFIRDLLAKIPVEFTVSDNINGSNDNHNITKLLIPINLYNKHWVGLVLEHSSDKVTVYYMDSENKPMTKILRSSFEDELAKLYPDLHIKITEQQVQEQKYNNCGLEVIENLIAMCCGIRVTQDEALALHSLLFQDSVLKQGIIDTSLAPTLRIGEDNKQLNSDNVIYRFAETSTQYLLGEEGMLLNCNSI
ncbi:tetratricopeptide repeat protein [Rickettsia endosymbiont of Aspidapion aeneum]|uniref:tetratricopeptide repeat protein n=1 Tax=Rickettsia endosymbiont of Aspidapion aeneum TaxID=3066247 RepID=UPI00313B174D